MTHKTVLLLQLVLLSLGTPAIAAGFASVPLDVPVKLTVPGGRSREQLQVKSYSHIIWSFLAKPGEKSTEKS